MFNRFFIPAFLVTLRSESASPNDYKSSSHLQIAECWHEISMRKSDTSRLNFKMPARVYV